MDEDVVDDRARVLRRRLTPWLYLIYLKKKTTNDASIRPGKHAIKMTIKASTRLKC